MVQERIQLSLVITAKDTNDPKLADLLRSIEAQDFNKDALEVLVITEGTSESAKAIGIRKAKGEVIGILASDNELVYPQTLEFGYKNAMTFGASSCSYYEYKPSDDFLNRYFSLMGGNDPLAYYMGKNDRSSMLGDRPNPEGTIGDNGFFIRKELIEKTDLDNYYHIDNAIESEAFVRWIPFPIWHKTGGSILKFFRKRYHYGLQHAFNSNRRWHLVDFKKGGDVLRLLWFILASVTFIHPLVTAMRGYIKIRDLAWFIAPVMCFLTVVTYAILVVHLTIRRVFQSSSARMVGTA